MIEQQQRFPGENSIEYILIRILYLWLLSGTVGNGRTAPFDLFVTFALEANRKRYKVHYSTLFDWLMQWKNTEFLTYSKTNGLHTAISQANIQCIERTQYKTMQWWHLWNCTECAQKPSNAQCCIRRPCFPYHLCRSHCMYSLVDHTFKQHSKRTNTWWINRIWSASPPILIRCLACQL